MRQTDIMEKRIIGEIEKKLNYVFRDKRLLEQAFTHSSYANAENVADNERMEFFGDAILEYLSSEYLYERFDVCREGELSAMRAKLVSAEGLFPVVDKFGLTRYLRALNGVPSHKTEANLYEAVLCAVYLDGGMQCAREFFLYSMSDSLQNALKALKKDGKTLLQEYCQKRKLSVEYKFVGREGPDNKPLFHCELFVNGKKEAEGNGLSKKAAEQDAANKLVENWRIDKCYI